MIPKVICHTPVVRTANPFEQVFDGLFGVDGLAKKAANAAACCVAATDLYETDEVYRAEFDVPGFDEKDIEVTLDRRILNVKGRRKSANPEDVTFHLRERGSLEFSRALMLPAEVEHGDVDARLDNGVLTVTLRKSPKERTSRVEVVRNNTP